ncbi:MAG: hypothetical protein KF682_21120 [Nitrospira sp.]|nr:hypothetical protein [Nitrospira sp.]
MIDRDLIDRIPDREELTIPFKDKAAKSALDYMLETIRYAILTAIGILPLMLVLGVPPEAIKATGFYTAVFSLVSVPVFFVLGYFCGVKPRVLGGK